MRESARQTQHRGLNPPRWDRLRAVSLETVLRLSAALPDRYDPRKWHTAQGALSIKGTKFFLWNCGQGGGGALDLVMRLQGLDFRHAVEWLSARVALELSTEPSPSSTSTLQLPPPVPALLTRVEAYLTGTRALPAALLRPLFQAGTIYADARANAVFLLRGAKAEPVGAELRGTTEVCWRGMAPGSRKDLGYFEAPRPKTPTAFILCESAIDALSAAVLHPEHHCLSTAGARPHPRWLEPLLRQELPVYCGFDTDATGEAMAQEMLRCHPTVQRLRPALHDWNDDLRAKR